MYKNIYQAERAVLINCVKHSRWHRGIGCMYRIYQVPAEFDCGELPSCFEIIFQIGTDNVLREYKWDKTVFGIED